MITLLYTIVGIRDRMPRADHKAGEPEPAVTPYGYLAVDLLWRALDGSPLRDDGATEIPDQVNVPLKSSREYILQVIEAKRQDLYTALDKPGFGITVEPEPVSDDLLSLIGEQG